MELAKLPAGGRLSAAVREGLEHHRAGRLREAAQCYQRAHGENPADADALALLGILARRSGQLEDAIRLTALAVELRPEHAGFRLSLAQAYLLTRKTDAAEDCCWQVLEKHPDAAAAWCCLGEVELARGNEMNARLDWEHAIACGGASSRAEKALGHLLARRGEIEAAVRMYRAAVRKTPRDATLHFALGAALAARADKSGARAAYEEALRLRPNFPEVLLNLGNLFYDEGDWGRAALCCRRALRLRPDYARAWCNLGNALQMLGAARAAIECYERMLGIAPRTVAAHHNLGNAWLARKDFQRAEACFRRTLAIEERAEHHNSLGNALYQQRRDREATACYRKALELDPNYASAHTNLANALLREGQREEMIAHYQRAVELDPQSAGGHYNLALAHLREGRCGEGWREHEWRWDFRELKLTRRKFAAPQWKGEALNGAAILLHAEQGLGDTLQFIRYAPLVAERGGSVVVEVQPPLQRLLGRLPGVKQVIARGAPLPSFAWHCPLMSLPLAFATEVGTIPVRTPYVHAEQSEVETAWRRWPGEGLRVGVAWAGNPRHGNDRQRSMALRELQPLADVEGVRWYSLQTGAAERQLRELAFPAVDALAGVTDFAVTAALMGTLDLVISVDTAVAHLAGAMGIPVWVVLPQLADWRWMDKREDSPWYPTARLFRQQTAGDWSAPVENMREVLQGMVAHRGGVSGKWRAKCTTPWKPASEPDVRAPRIAPSAQVMGCGAGMGPG